MLESNPKISQIAKWPRRQSNHKLFSQIGNWPTSQSILDLTNVYQSNPEINLIFRIFEELFFFRIIFSVSVLSWSHHDEFRKAFDQAIKNLSEEKGPSSVLISRETYNAIVERLTEIANSRERKSNRKIIVSWTGMSCTPYYEMLRKNFERRGHDLASADPLSYTTNPEETWRIG